MTTKDKALALVKQFYPECRDDYQGRRLQIAMAAIEQHEAFQQEVSDECIVLGFKPAPIGIGRFIIPAPKPDPLVDVLLEMDLSSDPEEGQHDAKWLRIKLDALGFEIRKRTMVKLSNAEEAWVVAENELRATKQELADFKQEVSDVVAEYKADQPHIWDHSARCFAQFIIHEPKPDPLMEIIGEIDDGTWGETKAEYADRLRAALDARGFEIREKSDG